MKQYNYEEDEEGKTGSGEAGGKSGVVGPRIHVEALRDDLLPTGEIKRLLLVHADLHKTYVDKQKQLRNERVALKEGRKTQTQQYQTGLNAGLGGGVSRFKKHPISNRAQFSGVDKQVTQVPSEYEADTNAEARAELENKLTFKHQYQPKREFNPKPRPY